MRRMKSAAAPPVRVDGFKLQERLVRRKTTLTEVAYAINVPYYNAERWLSGGEIDPVKRYHLSRLLRCQMRDLVPDDWRDDVPETRKE